MNNILFLFILFITGISQLLSSISAHAYQSWSPEQPILDSSIGQKDLYHEEVQASEEQQFIEYGYAFWTKWSFVYPQYVGQIKGWYSLARLTNHPNHNDFKSPGDRTLATFIGNHAYYFATYDQLNPNLDATINHNSQIDAQWNYIYFCYAHGIAKAYLWLASTQLQEISIQAQHLPTQYLHFILGKEFAFPGFNGQFSQVQLNVGEGAFIYQREEVQMLASAFNPQIIPDEPKTHVLLKEEQEVTASESLAITYSEEFEYLDEYSISGWVKWSPAAKIDVWNLVARMSFLDGNNRSPGNRVLTILKSLQFYSFHTYTCLSNCNPDISTPIKFPEMIDRAWTFLYMGYSREMMRAHSYAEFLTYKKEADIENVQHFVITGKVRVQLQKDDYLSGFNGAMKNWVVNFGKGAYSEQYDEQSVNYGYNLEKVEQFPGLDQSMEQIQEEVFVEEFDDSKNINGITDYSYGFWSRFVWNKQDSQLLNKPELMGVARLATNKDWTKDRQNGDRALVTVLGAGVYQFISYEDKEELKYDNNLDGRWIYIYFGYQRESSEKANLKGVIMFDNKVVRQTQFKDVQIHHPILDYLYLSVGTASSRWTDFHGQWTQLSLKLGHGAFLEEFRGDSFMVPQYPELESESYEIMEGQVSEFSGEEIVLEKSSQQSEYSVELWFRWMMTTDRMPLETIYVLSYGQGGNNVKAGDRVLSLFQDKQHRLLFSSYTTVVDRFEKLVSECFVSDVADQASWMYAYFGYSREQVSLTYLLQSRSRDCFGRMQATHRVPDQLKLQYGKDNFNSAFHGKLAYLSVHLGKESYKNEISQIKMSQCHMQGNELKPATIEWNELAQEKILLDYNQGNVIQEEFIDRDDMNMDGQEHYGFGFWSKFLHAYPSRIENMPSHMSVARLTSNVDYTDQSKFGDRLLAVFLTKSAYQFSTYNILKNVNNQVIETPYRSFLEGQWNYIYLSYSALEQALISFTIFGSTNEIVRNQEYQLQHKTLTGYAAFSMGAEFNYIGFNGIVTDIVVRFDANAFVKDASAFTQLQVPNDSYADLQKYESNEELDLGEENIFVTEYSVYGWFKPSPVFVQASPRPITQLLRLTNNQPDFLPNREGYNTLAVYINQFQYDFHTYSMDNQPNIKKQINLGPEFGAWTYFYMAYSFKLKTVHVYVQFPYREEQFKIEGINHMTPGYLAFHAQFEGQSAHTGCSTGVTAYKEEEYPFLFGFDPMPDYIFESDQQMFDTPSSEEFALDQTFEEKDISGAMEYSWGIWTRWLMAYPSRLERKDVWHSVLRLSSTKNYQNLNAAGNRLLTSFVGRGFYQFCTYDLDSKSNNVCKDIDYEDDLEGNWNYLYFSYAQNKAVSYVYFSNIEEYKSQRFEVVHRPLLDFLRVKLAPKEFVYEPFHGQLYDLRVIVGGGFVDNEQDLNSWLYQHRKPESAYFAKQHIDALEEAREIGSVTKKEAVVIEDMDFTPEYAVSGWYKFEQNPHIESLVFRLTINSPEIQKDDSLAGDRTLFYTIKESEHKFGTYNYHNLDRFNSEDDNIVEGSVMKNKITNEWIYTYFGYNFHKKTAFAKVISSEEIIIAKFKDINHIVPVKFYLYLGADGLLPNFEGVFQNWDLHFGPGSYSEKPEDEMQPPSQKPTKILIQNKNIRKSNV